MAQGGQKDLTKILSDQKTQRLYKLEENFNTSPNRVYLIEDRQGRKNIVLACLKSKIGDDFPISKSGLEGVVHIQEDNGPLHYMIGRAYVVLYEKGFYDQEFVARDTAKNIKERRRLPDIFWRKGKDGRSDYGMLDRNLEPVFGTKTYQHELPFDETKPTGAWHPSKVNYSPPVEEPSPKVIKSEPVRPSDAKVQLIDYTGCGTANPSRHAANLLVFTKSTRLHMDPVLMEDIESWDWEDIEEQLKYMANTIPSSWEFINYTFLINNVTRAFTHQFVRTRTGSYAQQTMRVLDVDGWTYGEGPTVQDGECSEIYRDCMDYISVAYNEMIDKGTKIEDARGVLPTNIHTNIVAKFDLRALVEMARKRASSRVQGEYRDVLDAMIREVIDAHSWTTIFFNRTFDRSAKDLENEILSLGLDKDKQTNLVKLIDQMRTSG